MKRKGLWRDKETQCLAKEERMKRGLKTKKKKLCYTQMKQTPPVTYKITEQRRHFLSWKNPECINNIYFAQMIGISAFLKSQKLLDIWKY